ncbi:hypothetical protein D3C71_1830510 [compost metagenome]
MVLLHRFAQLVFRQKIGKKRRQCSCYGLRIFAETTGGRTKRQAEHREPAGRTIAVLEAECVKVARRPDDRPNFEIIQEYLERRN